MAHDTARCPIARRTALGGLVSGIGGWLLAGKLATQNPGPPAILDLHHHFYAPPLKKFVDNVPFLKAMLEYSPEKSLEAMDQAGVARSILSARLWLGDNPLAERKALIAASREMSEYGAKVVSDYKSRFGLFAMLPLIEWPTDSTRAIWSMINDDASGAPKESMATRYANVQFIWSHAGGTLLGLVSRFLDDAASAASLGRTPDRNSRLYHLRRFFYDTAGSTNPIQMQALKRLVGASQIVFGSDFPFGSLAKRVQQLEKCEFGTGELRGIQRDNGLRILAQRA